MTAGTKIHGLGVVSPALKTIVLCADDFGMAPGIDAGILALARTQRLSAVSCMSRGRHFRSDVPELAGLPIDRGLHLDLTELRPGAESGAFYQPLRRLIWHCWSRTIAPGIITLEIERQLDAFEDALGAAPDYVDGHQHVHQFPVIRDCLVEVLRRRYTGSLPWLRSTLPRDCPGVSLPDRLKASVIGHLGGESLKALAGRHGLAMNARLLGVYGFAGGQEAYSALLDSWLASAAGSDLLMCHPAKFADPADPLAGQRVAEYALLSGERLPALLARHGVVIGRL
ncbi:ChbG/HpnK family deacetylase [Accumulibacter sp.]|uniref:ChbG/HpnK family deacetylase n=1 Tax=Accumulibacter sp. TaxID=2053492 RepID=UPI00262AB407|nr:ChbG/HpnK family deacetylase [Accumulibacter sp.]